MGSREGRELRTGNRKGGKGERGKDRGKRKGKELRPGNRE